MNALVTGGGGFLGRRLVEMLQARGDTVRALGRGAYPDLEAAGVTVLRGDVRDAGACSRACAGVDTVFHAAALAGVWGPRQPYFEVNVGGTANILEACRLNRVRSLVYTSSPSVAIGGADIEGGDESLPYPRRYLAAYPASKAAAERLVLAADGCEIGRSEAEAGGPGQGRGAIATVPLRTCALRPHLIWGPRDPHLLPRLVRAAQAGRLAQIGAGLNRVDIAYIDNAAHAHVLAADELAGQGRCAGKAYFIGDAEPVRLWDWLNGVLQRLGVPPVRRRLPLGTAWALALCMEVTHRVFPFLGEPLLTRFTVSQLAHSHWFRHERAAADFGYQPVVGPEEALDRLVEWGRVALR